MPRLISAKTCLINVICAYKALNR
uniref:Uncharacterized protein n=1 Tax=Anguilla anguilla TaxID=7936 RepID=A0A0E9U560_ANGAN